MTSTCQDNGELTPVEQCLPSHCIGSPPSNVASNLEIYYQNSLFSLGQDPPVGAFLEYRCPPDHFFESNQSLSSFEVECGLDGQFENPVTWPICIEKLTCSTSDLLTSIFNFYPQPHPIISNPGDTFTMSCTSPAFAVAHLSNSTTYSNFQVECLETGVWNVINFNDFKCLRIGCDLPSVPHGFIGPVLFNASFFPTFVPFDQSVAFVCPPHQRFSDDFDISRLDVFCRDDGIDGRMEMPSNLPWCVEHTKCSTKHWDELVQLRKVKDLVRRADKSLWTATGSPIYSVTYLPPSNMLDDDAFTLYHSETSFLYSWIEVDLQITLKVYMISIAKRFTSCCQRYQGIETRVGSTKVTLPPDEQSNQAITINQICRHIDDYSNEGYLIDFKCITPIEGRYVTIQKMGHAILQLNNVEIYHITEYADDEDTEIVTPLARDCEALYQLGFKAPGIYRIDPTGLQSSSSAVQVHCKNGWTLVLKRDHLANDKIDFSSKTLTEMENLLGNPTNDFWIGLQAFHKLTTSNHYKLKVTMTTEGGKSGMVQYEHMNIQEGPEYTMKVEGFSTPFGLAVEDDLSENSETSFVVSGRCFEASEAPGWYNPSETDCGKVNFFGAKMSWASLGRLSSIIMEIKPVQKPQCTLSNGECVFPWTYSWNGRTYLECDFVFDPTVWCPTQLNADGVYISGSGHWSSCPTSCPGSTAADYGLINPGGFLRDGTPRSFETFKLSCPQGQTVMVDGVPRDDYETTCNWDKSWTDDITVTCEWSACNRPPVPPDDTHLILHGWNGEPIAIEQNWEFVCPDGLQPPGEPEYSLETKVVIQVKCLANNTFAEPSTWPKCVSMKQCPAREGPPSTPTNGSAVLTNRGTTFGPCIDRFSNTFQCNGEVGIRTESRSLPCTQGLCSKYSIIFNPSQPIQSQFLRIQFSSNVNLVGIDNGHEVSQVNQNEILISGTNLNAFPGSTTSFAFEVSHEAISQKTLPCVYEFQCSDNNNDGWFELPSTTNGTFDPTNESFNYGSTITYKCGPGLQFVDEHDNPTLPEQNFTCDFDEEWFPASPIQRCEWSHCVSPPNVTDLVPKFWNESSMTPIGSNLTMICARGMKFEGNFSQTDVNPVCSPQNQWEDPMNGWGKCVETVFCDPPPSTIPKGSIDILQSGLSFGTSCLGSQMREPIPSTDCPALEAQINERTGNSTRIRLLVKHPASIRLTMLMIFSQPVTTAQSESTQVSVLPSGIENAILTSMNLDGAFSQFNIQIAHDSETEPCFLQAMCSNYLSNADCLDQGLGLMKNLDLSLDLTQYGTTIAYKCPPGQRFVDNSTSQILSCGWKKQWQPSNQLLGCEVVACANPPLAPNGTRLMNNYTMDDEVAFHDHVSYFCPDGFFFEEDYDQQFFNLTCLIGGNWSAPLHWPRCLEPREKFCHDPPQPPTNGGIYDWNKDSFANGTSPFGLEVRYSCDIARQLENQTLVQSGQDPLYDEAVLKCAWNGKWSPSERLDPCVWNKCINPPIPNGNNLKHSWHGQPLDFYDNVTYTCAFEGYWFEDDRDLVAFDVPCLPGGRFGVPSPWPLCLQTVECESPPPKPRGGIWNWDGTSREYGTTIEYECGPNAMFQEVLNDGSPGNFYKSKSISCNWNRTWTPERLDRCIWSKCNAIPEPEPSTGLQFVPDNSTKSLQILTNYSKYMPEIPLTLAVSLDFRSGSSLLLDGYLHDLIQDNPRLILTNEAGKKFLDITIEPFFSLMKVTSDLRPNFEYEEILQIDAGAPFKLEVAYLPEKFEFQLTFNDESLARFKIPDSLPDLEIESLILTGDVDMNYVGRKPKGFDSRVAVGTKVEFTCPSGQVFEHNWYARPSFKMTCLNTGVFDAPNIFPSCVEPFTSTYRTLNASEAFTELCKYLNGFVIQVFSIMEIMPSNTCL